VAPPAWPSSAPSASTINSRCLEYVYKSRLIRELVDKRGVMLELNVARARKPAQALTEGVAHPRDSVHDAERRAAGAPVGHALAVAFDGKKVRVEAVVEPSKARPVKRLVAANRSRR
jgi:hypothetical protein